jgi:molecular chaperone GrpE
MDKEQKENPANEAEIEHKAKIPDMSASSIEGRKSEISLEQPTSSVEPSEIKCLEEIEKEYQEKIKEMEDKFLRLAAEFDNYKKRAARQYDEIVKSANENLIIQMLNVADNFQRALGASRNGSDYSSLQQGTELIYQYLEDILNKEGVEKIIAVGEAFDPHLHDAMMQVESDQYPEGVIAQEISPGYKLKGKVIRHSRVVVSRGKKPASENDDSLKKND